MTVRTAERADLHRVGFDDAEIEVLDSLRLDYVTPSAADPTPDLHRGYMAAARLEWGRVLYETGYLREATAADDLLDYLHGVRSADAGGA